MLQNRSARPVWGAILGVAVAAALLSFVVAYAVGIPFVYRGKWIQFFILAYLQANLILVWSMLRPGVILRGVKLVPKRELWMGVAGVVVGPLVTSFALLLFVPFLATLAASEPSSRRFVFLGQEAFARESRGLVKLRLVDETGAEHEVSVRRASVVRLALENGNLLCTHGRSFILGYVVDYMTRGESGEKCPAR